MTLVDTSVWIEFFRRTRPLDLEVQVPIDEIVTCLPVIQEVLQGFRDEAAYRLARDAMLALPIVESPIRGVVFDDAIGLFRSARRQGLTVRSSVECLIAACAIRHYGSDRSDSDAPGNPFGPGAIPGDGVRWSRAARR